MNTMTAREVLRAIADGADPSEFEWLNVLGDWIVVKADVWKLADFDYPKNQFRRKPRTRVVNGFTVPAPIQEMPKEHIEVCIASPEDHYFVRYVDFQTQYKQHINWFKRGLLFSTKEAAIANAKAMCGINPDSEA